MLRVIGAAEAVEVSEEIVISERIARGNLDSAERFATTLLSSFQDERFSPLPIYVGPLIISVANLSIQEPMLLPFVSSLSRTDMPFMEHSILAWAPL